MGGSLSFSDHKMPVPPRRVRGWVGVLVNCLNQAVTGALYYLLGLVERHAGDSRHVNGCVCLDVVGIWIGAAQLAERVAARLRYSSIWEDVSDNRAAIIDRTETHHQRYRWRLPSEPIGHHEALGARPFQG